MLRDRWRVVRYDAFPLPTALALDDAILDSVSFRLAGPTLRFYGVHPSAVSIGRSQRMDEAVDVEECRRTDINIVRRRTEGLSYLHDTGKEVDFSMTCPEGMLSLDPAETFQEVGGRVVNALKLVGIEASFTGPDKVAVDGRTICHLYQVREKGMVQVQGFLLHEIDRPLTDKLLRRSIEGTTSAASPGEGITSIRDLKKLPWDYTLAALVNAFIMNRQWYPGDLTNDELTRAELISSRIYSDARWNADGKVAGQEG